MCMMCEEEAMYEAYLEYLARKQAEQANAGSKPATTPQAGAFACDPAPEAEAELAPAPASKVAS